ncbi:MAG TPA: proton-conducting transporter membrane subunit, partial [Candidatus Paceibacterota bacterium]|nr:proton-conducting transporter membrane subunit [Candidatus Paceibacterota bacterium]
TGTLLCYDEGRGCLEAAALAGLVERVSVGGITVATAISLLIFCGAIGKSGQVPLHVWLPDAMEGPTPVSALIHAATMVAAGVFLVARVYPLMDADVAGEPGLSAALQGVAWVGAVTAVMAAAIAAAQFDLKRILAYSTVSQLGYMMMALGVGGYAVGMFHLIAHAFFKALLFLGAGSAIHGCHHERDIRRMGGLRRWMPVTFAAHAVGMMALAGVPLFFCGFWSKDGILHAAWGWPVSRLPFLLGLAGVGLTAFYMMRQMAMVYGGEYRGGQLKKEIHESPAVMRVPMVILAVAVVLLSVVGTPAWPWLEEFLEGREAAVRAGDLFEHETLWIMGASALVMGAGLVAGWRLYGRRPQRRADAPDPLRMAQPAVFSLLEQRLRFDEVYEATVVRSAAWAAEAWDWLEREVWQGLMQWAGYGALAAGWLSRLSDEYLVNPAFDGGCEGVRGCGRGMSGWHGGRLRIYLRVVAAGMAAMAVWLTWG